jgi:putative transposase
LRNKTIQVRYSRSQRDKFIVYFKDKRMGKASALDLHFNAQSRMKTELS